MWRAALYFLALALAVAVLLRRYDVELQHAVAANAERGSLLDTNAIIFGGTAGIGRALAERLAAGGASVTIVGRNEEVGNDIVARLRSTHTEFVDKGATYDFIKADLSLLVNAKAAVKRFSSKHDRLDYVVFCQTKATIQGRTPTSEDDRLDEKLTLNYYSRVYLTELLVPILKRTKTRYDADPRVMSVLSAGVHAPYTAYATDPYLKEHYGLKNAADAAGFYTDLWMDRMAQEHPEITFVHAAPGFVATNWGTDLPVVLRFVVRGLQALLGREPRDCAELIAQGLLASNIQGGARLIDEFGTPAQRTDLHTEHSVATNWNFTYAVLQRHL